MPSEESIQQKLQADQNTYELEKSQLTAPQQRAIENQEVQVQLAEIQREQDEITQMQAEIDPLHSRSSKISSDVGDTAGVIVGGAAIAGLLRWVYLANSGGNDAIVGYVLFGVPSVIFGAGAGVLAGGGVSEGLYYVLTKAQQKQIADLSAQLRASKEKLQLIVDAYNLIH
jgi:hypothetical protein